MTLYCDRYLCERVVPGNRVFVLGIYSIKEINKPSRREGREKAIKGVRAAYMRILGIQLDAEGLGSKGRASVPADEEDAYRGMATSPNIYERLASSIAPAERHNENAALSDSTDKTWLNTSKSHFEEHLELETLLALRALKF